MNDSLNEIIGHRWHPATGPSRVTITYQGIEDRFLVYQTCLAEHEYQRIANWDGFVGINSARRWVRSRYWPQAEVVEN